MKKALGTILFVIYAIIAITVTVLLLSYNDYNNSQLGGYTVYIVKDDSLEPKFKQGSILLIKSTSDKNVQIGDELFMYKVINSQEYEVIDTTLKAKTQQGRHITYIFDEDESYANEYFIGKVSDTVVIQGWGYVLNLLESKWGFLILIVFPSLLAFLYELWEFIANIKAAKEDDDDEEEDDEDEDEEEKVVEKKAPVKNTTSTASKAKKTTTGTSQKTTTKKTTTTKSASTAKKTTTSKPKTTTKKTTKTKEQ